jgi:FkbM family methyltransferase
MSARNPAKHDDLIYDVGMHRGEDTYTYLQKGFRVIAFEADPDLANACRELFGEAIAENRLTIVEGAIVADTTEKTITFYKNPVATIWGTVDPEWAARNERMGWPSEEVTVDVVDMKECFLKHGVPRYMKIDIEGADMICLEKLLETEIRPDYVSVESDKKSIDGILKEIDLLTQLGYDRFKAIQQATISKQPIPNPPLEGTGLIAHIPPGSSGLFGRELPHTWKTRQQIIAQYRKIMVGYKIFGNDTFVRRNPITRFFWQLAQRITRRSIPGWYDTHAVHSSVHE